MIRSRVQMVGTQRSGSNLLRLILGSLPEVVAPPSAHELRDFQELVGAYGPLTETSNRTRLVDDLRGLIASNALAWPALRQSSADIAGRMTGATLAHAVVALYDAVAEQAGATAWVSKCLENVHFADQLLHKGLGIKFLHLVRDPRDVGISFRAAPIGPKEPRAVALAWRADQEVASSVRQAVGPDRWFEIRYEDLVGEPSATLGGVCEFIGVEWGPAALGFFERREARHAVTLSQLWRNLDLPVNDASVGRYRAPEHGEFVSAIESVVADLMRRYGYEPRYRAAAEPVDHAERQRIEHVDRELRSRARRVTAAADTEHLHVRRDAYLRDLRTRLGIDASRP